MMERLAVAALAIAAVWAGWAWYFVRIGPNPEEGLTLIMAVSVAGYLAYMPRTSNTDHSTTVSFPRMRESIHDSRKYYHRLIGLLAAYALSWFCAPPIISCTLAIIITLTSLSIAFIGRPPSIALCVLMAGSMPVLPSLQFLLGYPMRAISAVLATHILHMQGLAVAREGTFLTRQGQTIQFDAPCSGVNMLWAGILVTCLLAAFTDCRLPRFLLALVACAGVIIVSNVMRAVCLFHLETALGNDMPSWWHSGVGIISFVMVLPVLWFCVAFNGKLTTTTQEAASCGG